MITAPKSPRSHPDRGVHAEEAIEASFETLADRAFLMGWTRDEAAFALLNLAAARVLTIDANRSTQEAIAHAASLVGRCLNALAVRCG